MITSVITFAALFSASVQAAVVGPPAQSDSPWNHHKDYTWTGAAPSFNLVQKVSVSADGGSSYLLADGGLYSCGHYSVATEKCIYIYGNPAGTASAAIVPNGKNGYILDFDTQGSTVGLILQMDGTLSSVPASQFTAPAGTLSVVKSGLTGYSRISCGTDKCVLAPTANQAYGPDLAPIASISLTSPYTVSPLPGFIGDLVDYHSVNNLILAVDSYSNNIYVADGTTVAYSSPSKITPPLPNHNIGQVVAATGKIFVLQQGNLYKATYTDIASLSALTASSWTLVWGNSTPTTDNKDVVGGPILNIALFTQGAQYLQVAYKIGGVLGGGDGVISSW